MIRVAAFTGGYNVPSARFRIRQHVSELMRYGISLEEHVARFSSYPPFNKPIRPVWAGASLLQRIPGIVKSYQSDIVIIQREMISKYATFECLTNRPRIFDVDDAIWLNREGAAQKLSQWSDSLICGNSFLADYFSKWNPNIHIVPTAVDCSRFQPTTNNRSAYHVIVWSGTSSGFEYLYSIEDALRKILKARSDIRLRIIANKRPKFSTIPSKSIDYVKWTPADEVKGLQTADVGIMPLYDTPWAKGKCSYKMLTYMACGLPVVISPVGMNVDVLSQAKAGFSAQGNAEWIESVFYCLDNPQRAKKLGSNGRALIESRYSLTRVASLLAGIINNMI